MGDRLTERTGLCLFNVEVYPLMITSCIGEKLHLFLRDCHVIAVSQMLANMGFEIFVVFDDCGHGQSLAIPDALVFTGLGVEEKCDERNIKGDTDQRTAENTTGKIVGELHGRIE